MTDKQTNLHPKNDSSVNLKPNIISGNIPDKAVTLEKLDQNLQNTISNQNEKISNIAINVETNAFKIFANTTEIENLKESVNTDTFDPTSDNPASQKSIFERRIDLSKIVDSHGNKRFVEFEGITDGIAGFTITYNKASLSGTHLMIVLAGSIANGTILTNGTILCRFNIPSYISNKIYPVISNIVDFKTVSSFANNWSTQDLSTALQLGTNVLSITKSGAITFTDDRTFRIQYDLLIDSE